MVRKALFRAHVEGQLKVDFFGSCGYLSLCCVLQFTNKLVASLQNEIMSKPEQFVEPDPELPLALLDQKEVSLVFNNYIIWPSFLATQLMMFNLWILLHQAGKRLLLITNSDYHYTDKMMQHSFDRFLPNEMGWRDLFDMVSILQFMPTINLSLYLLLFEYVVDWGPLHYLCWVFPSCFEFESNIFASHTKTKCGNLGLRISSSLKTDEKYLVCPISCTQKFRGRFSSLWD